MRERERERKREREIAIRLWWFAINPYIDVVFIPQNDFENIEPLETQLNSNLKTFSFFF